MGRNKILISLLFVVIFGLLSIQSVAQGFEKYNSYSFSVFVDNIDVGDTVGFNIFSNGLKQYYSQLIDDSIKKHKKGAVKNIYQEIDTINRKRFMVIVTSKAGKGYLQANKNLSKYIEEIKIGNAKILYFINDKYISEKGDISQLLSLKEKDIKGINYYFSATNDSLKVKIQLKNERNK